MVLRIMSDISCEHCILNSQLEGGAIDEEGISSSFCRERLREGATLPRFAADMFGRKGELIAVLAKDLGKWLLLG